ncbi:type I-E CRISPR-associated protein Cse1/CasA [Marinitenerispora sediminis]|uniref:Type I-E CRISPR-associated protein Cse1/CasA n=1 Tax=Marinitenerispora sediminis TaxID=1931232 RepID=A0A368T260_9ACTN|nr:type I-E CRISPR-associated protein Cse1/CasA [Marinitenerispora sediminis]RCV51384.1 type I-E CRISPR-associated protein Cse1/CasA [Marinitenerispora sediminis]RCV55087.1 type I-E CRISPR-associated protein Cse1/CasA [Marinitenerispora sediminis]RCV58109.1 type I-E CRISPR-associated protein Cse1/CasA [Marinitenerispora sediminis]
MPPPAPFDLSVAPWLLAQPSAAGADVCRLGLRDVLARAHELSDVELPLPPATAGLWRVLALLTARVTGLDTAEDPEEWLLRRAGFLDAGRLPEDKHRDGPGIDAYFAGLPGRFDLFGAERPWMQDPRLRAECPKSAGVNKLVWGRPSGNNQVWLGHHVDADPAPVPAAEAAWALLMWLYYGPSGRCATRSVTGEAGTVTEANTTAGPLRRSVSFHPLGPTLFHSLLLNIPYPGDAEQADLAPWEEDRLPDPLGLPPSGDGLAARLVNRYRHAVLLSPSPDGREVEDAWITWAWRRPGPEIEDPYLIHDTSKAGSRYARPADADRAIWRDIDALLLKSSSKGTTRRPLIFDTCTAASGVPHELRKALRVRAYGFDQDGQTRDRQWFTAGTPPILDRLADEARDGTPEATLRVTTAHDAAERSARALAAALVAAWRDSAGVRDEEGPWRRAGMARFWPLAERKFWSIALDDDRTGPGNAFIRIALRVFDEVAGPYTRRPRVAEAVERARRGLYAGWVTENPPEENA